MSDGHDLVARYMAQLNGDLAMVTRRRRILVELATRHEVATVTTGELGAFLAERSSTPRADVVQLLDVRAFFVWAVRNEVRADNPTGPLWAALDESLHRAPCSSS